MPVIHVRPNGTKLATGAGDYASTADDWGLANCYDTLHQVGFNGMAGSPADYVLDGDEIILYSSLVVPVTHVLDNTRFRDINDGGTVTIKPKDGNADFCILSGSNATKLDLGFITVTSAQGFIIEDVTLTKSVTTTTINISNILIDEETNSVGFTRCKFKDYNTLISSANNAGISNLIYATPPDIITHRAVTFTDCSFNDIDLSYYTGGALMHFNATGGDTMTVTFNGTNTFNGMALTCNDAAGGQGGAIKTSVGATLTINGVFNVTDFTGTMVGEAGGNNAFIKADGPMNGDGVLTGTRLDVSGGIATSCFVHCTNTHDINEIHSIDCQTVPVGPAAVGTCACTFLAQSSAAIGTVRKINALRPRSKFGAAAYCSGGGTTVFGSVVCKDARLLHGAVYGGGDGDLIVHSLLITGTRQDAGLLNDGVSGLSDFLGTDIYSHVNATTGVRNKTSIFNQMTILDSDPDAEWSVDVRTTSATYDHTVQFNSAVFNSNNAIELHTQQGAGVSLTVTMTDCAIPIAEIDNVSGTIIQNNQITTDPQPNADGSLPEDSVLVGAGAKWWTGTNPVGADGEPFGDFGTDIGAVQSTHNPFHPTKL